MDNLFMWYFRLFISQFTEIFGGDFGFYAFMRFEEFRKLYFGTLKIKTEMGIFPIRLVKFGIFLQSAKIKRNYKPFVANLNTPIPTLSPLWERALNTHF